MSTQGTLRSGQLIDILHGVFDPIASGVPLGANATVALAAGDTAVPGNYDGIGNPTFPATLPGGVLITGCHIVVENTSDGGANTLAQINAGGPAGTVLSLPIIWPFGTTPLIAGAGYDCFTDAKVAFFGTAAGLQGAWVIANGVGALNNLQLAVPTALTITETGGANTLFAGRWHVYASYMSTI